MATPLIVAKFVTTTPAKTSNFYSFPYMGDFDLQPEFRLTEQAQTEGELVRDIGSPEREEFISIIGGPTIFADLKTQLKIEGTLTVRAEVFTTIKLVSVRRVQNIGPTITSDGTSITAATYDYVRCNVTFIRETD